MKRRIFRGGQSGMGCTYVFLQLTQASSESIICGSLGSSTNSQYPE
jgi:hypothetical protein